jgi:hypothetical protein
MQKNPLLNESKRQLLKRLSRYTPEQVKKIRSKMLSLGKKNGGWYNIDEYGKRMINGQKLRAQKLASRYKRNLKFETDSIHSGNGSTILMPDKNDIIRVSDNPFFDNKTITNKIGMERNILNNKNKNALSRKDIRKFTRDTRNASKRLSNADTLAHEVDEYSLSLANSKKLNIDPNVSVFANGLNQKKPFNAPSHSASTYIQSIRSSHVGGVLEREAKRKNLLSRMYGRDSFNSIPRDKKEYALNKRKYVLNHPATKEYALMNNINNDHELYKKGQNLRLQRFAREQRLTQRSVDNINHEVNVAHKQLENLFGFKMKKHTPEQVKRFADKLGDINIIDKRLRKRGIQPYIPIKDKENITYMPRNIRAIIGKPKEGMQANPEYINMVNFYTGSADKIDNYLSLLKDKKDIAYRFKNHI